ncbi:hypothetical protein AX774_g370 [Zancudomyces culisetae]|uniref:Uncharacterized protein n=1 Tax=Zancudomyces culisetae TaxID=1213189 RepID=A0A1R1PYN2_ZANCU|nr:hypothetical protein AX774_g370 [Zancudomyces culisetae]|eukprot:OMH86055.1 hypothetical protein AX774_g370 [Zancudomyces culisetae]
MNHWLHIQENRLNSEIDEFARKQREKLVSMAKIAENDYKLLCKKIENSSIVQKAKESAEAEDGDEEKDLDLFELEGVEVLPETGVDVAASGAGVETSLSNRNKSLSIMFPDSISKDSRIIASGIARYNLSQSYKAKGPLALPKLDPELTTNILRKSNDSDGGNDISDYSKYSSSIPVNIPISVSNTSGLPAANSSVYPTSNKSNSPNSGNFIPPHLIADSQRSNDPTHKFGSKPPESNIKRYKRVF